MCFHFCRAFVAASTHLGLCTCPGPILIHVKQVGIDTLTDLAETCRMGLLNRQFPTARPTCDCPEQCKYVREFDRKASQESHCYVATASFDTLFQLHFNLRIVTFILLPRATQLVILFKK